MDDEQSPLRNTVMSGSSSLDELCEQPVAVKPPRRRIFRFSPPAQIGMPLQRQTQQSQSRAESHSHPPETQADQDGEVERARLEVLARYQASGSLRGAAFDDISRLAAFICQTPISLISLVDSKRQWFLSSSGMDVCETSRDVSFCAHALIGPDMLIVPDAKADARFADNPAVTTEPAIRFYAGAPLVTPDGYTLGTLCVIDRQPRTLNREQKEALVSLSHLAMTHLELHRLKLTLPNSA